MNESERKNKKDFLVRFSKSSAILFFKKACLEILEKDQCMLFDATYNPLKYKRNYTHPIKKSFQRLKLNALQGPMVFKCGASKNCLSLPIIQGNNVYGHIVFLRLKHKPDKKILSAIKFLIDMTLKEFQKEEELTKLYDTIRPRAIALSTIHTIHRLLSSTLDMDELIERIARLTLQVMRSKYCSIMLLDPSRKYLIPKAVIDLKNNSKNLRKKYRKIKVGIGIEGKVAKTGRTSLSRNSICVPLIEEDIIGIITARNKTNKISFDKFELEILLTLAEQAVIAIKNAQMYEEQEKMFYGSIKSLAALLDTKSPNTYTHSDQFVKIVLEMAEEMKLPREDISNLHYAALLPDTGRFSIPEEILKKPGILSKKEYAVIKKQHLESLKILEHLEFLKPAMPIIRYHHERYDGTGYPEGLKGKKIPIGARIMAVVDAFEAMISLRPYKGKKISIPQAIKEIEKNKGTQFDPEAVNTFLAITKRPELKKDILKR